MTPTPRSLTARSVLLSVLLGTEPPRLPVGLLVRTAELFGIAEGTARTALSRMAAAGEVAATDGRYEIAAPRLLQRQVRQARSRRGDTLPWSAGDPWVQAVVVADGRRPPDERAALRAALRDARLAELREGIWMRPANLGPPPPIVADELSLAWFRATPDDPVALARRLWDLPGWAHVADDLRTDVASLTPALESGDRAALADGFVVSAAVLRHFQADPLLPAALLPGDWPGPPLRHDYDRFDAAYRAVLRAWFDEHR